MIWDFHTGNPVATNSHWPTLSGFADLVLAGAAILQAVQELWPCDRVRVADRGLREGLLLSLMSDQRRGRARRRRGGVASRRA